MNTKDFEKKLKNDISNVFDKILFDMKYKINLRVQSRAGAEISDILEKKFV